MTKRIKYDTLKLYRSHICPHCALLVVPFADGTHNGHCAKCGKVTYISMIETDVPLYRDQVRKMEVVFGGPEWFASIPEIPI